MFWKPLKSKKILAQIAQQYTLALAQISKWKREFLSSAENVFTADLKSQKSELETERDTLLKKIGELKVKNDFLKKQYAEKRGGRSGK